MCVIDKNVNAFANLGRNFNGSTVQGVGFDEETLVKAGVEDCGVMAAVAQFDNTRPHVAPEVGSRLFSVPHVIARHLYNPDHERAYMQLGIDYVCGTSLVAEDVFSKVVSGHGLSRHVRRVRGAALLAGPQLHRQAHHPAWASWSAITASASSRSSAATARPALFLRATPSSTTGIRCSPACAMS